MKTILAQPQYRRFLHRGLFRKMFASVLRQQFSSAERREIQRYGKYNNISKRHFTQFNKEGD